LSLVQIENARLRSGVKSVVLTFGAGPWHEYDLVREKLKDEILALDAAGAVRQSGAGHVMIFARASK
jgi:hypothetical protein